MNVMALLAHKYADVGPIDKARDSEPMLQLAAAIGADGEVGVDRASSFARNSCGKKTAGHFRPG